MDECSLKNHSCNKHQGNKETECDQCDFRHETVTGLVNHFLTVHEHHPELIHCQHCEFKAFDLPTIKNHMEVDHLELSMLGLVAANQTVVGQNFDKFKEELTKVLNTIIEDQNAINRSYLFRGKTAIKVTSKWTR